MQNAKWCFSKLCKMYRPVCEDPHQHGQDALPYDGPEPNEANLLVADAEGTKIENHDAHPGAHNALGEMRCLINPFLLTGQFM